MPSERDMRDHHLRLQRRFPGRTLVVVEPKDGRQPPLKKSKFVVDPELTHEQFIYCVRQNIDLKKHDALFLFHAGKMLCGNTLLSKDYVPGTPIRVVYSTEETFG